MDEYLSRKFVLSCVDSFLSKTDMPIAAQYFYDCFRECKAADVQLVVHGYWKECKIRGTLTQYCSVCGSDCGVLYPYDFCPNCGARMDLKDGDTE